MCGVAGLIDLRMPQEEAHSLLAAMLEKQHHRGPDARGQWQQEHVNLGHNRLSILDLSEAADQPMHRFGLSMIFNGEVYNYVELRTELVDLGYEFSTTGDTEVIMAAYAAWGASCVSRFMGMWVIVIWDSKREELFISRDRFGIKPLYYCLRDGRLHFSSEVKALRLSPLFSDELNPAHLYRYLQLGWVVDREETFYKAVHCLPPASNLIWKDGAVKISQYWDLDTRTSFDDSTVWGASRSSSRAERFEAFREAFLDSIKLHMRSDVEVGGCLSGGIDSSAIASAVGSLFPSVDFKTFTIYYTGDGDVDERPWVEKVVDRYPSLKPFYREPDGDEIAEIFDRALYHSDFPIGGSSPFSQYYVMSLAASHGVKVLLDGQGADEYLAGYMHSFYRHIGGGMRAFRPDLALARWWAHTSKQDFGFGKRLDVLAKSMLSWVSSEQRLFELEYKRYFPFLPADSSATPFALKNPGGSLLNQFLYHQLFTASLPTLLHYEDRNSMAFSIESRVPFLDHRLVELAISLPDSDKLAGGISKFPLRSSLADLLPPETVGRMDKKGFVTPGEVKWLRGPLKAQVETGFSSDLLNSARQAEVLSQYKGGSNKAARLVWRLATLQRWAK